LLTRLVPGVLLAVCAFGGPVEFGKSELIAALEARGIAATKLRFTWEVTPDPPESYRIESNRISGGDLRGLMYGLLEAAEQIRTAGKLSTTQGRPAVPMRGIRVIVDSAADLDGDGYWLAFVRMLARNRFNRLHVVFGQDAAQLPTPKLRSISQFAADHGVEFTLGLDQPDSVLGAVLHDCPAIRGVHIRTGPVSADLLHALRESGRLMKLDVNADLARQGIIKAAREAGVPLRVASDERGFMDLLERDPAAPTAEQLTPLPMINALPKAPVLSRPYEVYWTPPTHRLFLWGDPERVRRSVSWFTISDTQGFEIEPPISRSTVFTAANKQRAFWTHDFERYWLFYMLWGRLSYDPTTPERVWTHELERRFGASASDIMLLYRFGSRVLAEIAMRDGDHLASADEAVRNRIDGKTSAKRTPAETSSHLHALARDLQQVLERVKKTPGAATPEWLSSQVDFEVLATLALYHARKQSGADSLALYELAASEKAMHAARRELTAALGIWKRVTTITDDTYSVTPWKDELVTESSRTSERAAPYDSKDAVEHWPEYLPRPSINHVPPPSFAIGKPVSLTLQIAPVNSIRSVRLYYRPLNDQEKFRCVESDARATITFTIPPQDLPSRYDFTYYFELLHDRYGGWFLPDPDIATPYFVLRGKKP
jgi:hypothetical protein